MEAPKILCRTSQTSLPCPCYTHSVSRRGWTHSILRGESMRSAAIVLVVLALTLSCLAQDNSTGAIHGAVFEPPIRRIAEAKVALVNSATGFRYEQSTNSQGQFAFELLPPGECTARVTSEGMSPQLSGTLQVDIGGVTGIAFQMTLAGARESVTISAEAKAVETEPRGLSAVIAERAILNLPLNGRRFTDLALLTPGVTQDPRGLRSTSNGDLSFGGIRGFQTTYLVDGADNNNAFFAQAADAIAPPINVRMTSRNSASRPIPSPPNPDAPVAPWST